MSFSMFRFTFAQRFSIGLRVGVPVGQSAKAFTIWTDKTID
jgi:hypothetical protein